MSRPHRSITRSPLAAVAGSGLTLKQRIAVLGTVLLTALGLLVALQSGSARAATHSVLDLRDTFERNVHAGFGSAQRGGPWAVGANSRRAHFSVGNGRGTIGPLAGGRSAAASLRAVQVANQRLRVAFELPHQARRGGGVQLSLNLRHVAGGNAYRATVRVRPNGKMSIWLIRYHHHAAHRVSKVRTFRAPLNHRAIVLEASVVGRDTIVVHARAWVRGRAVPNWQARYTDTTSARVIGPGSVGVAVYNTRHMPPALVTVNSVLGWITTPQTTSPPPPPRRKRGSLAVGDAAYSVPSGALFVSSSQGSDSNAGTQAQPLRTVAAAVRAASGGQTIVLRGGTYHEDLFIDSSKRVTIQAYPHEAVWFDGSVPVANWAQHGATWVATGWTAQFDHSASFSTGSDAGGFVNPAHPMAAYPDQVFLDGDQLEQVNAASTPGPGQFAVDYHAQTITIGSNPAGHSVRASDLAQAFVVAGTVTLRGFGVRRYATALPQIGTIFFGGHVGGSVVENLVVTDNATQGVGVSAHNIVINHLSSLDNGMTGLMGNQADGLIIENSLFDGNNTQLFNDAPSAGGIKVCTTNGLTVRDNTVRRNPGINGIWTDLSVTNFKIIDNSVSVTGPYGIITELSDTGIVADNSISGARYGYTALDTGNVKVFNNDFANNTVWDLGASQDERRNTDPATKAAVPWLVRNVTVSDNLYGSAGSFQFYALDKATHIPASNMNITVDGNAFPGNTHAVMVGWGGSDNTTVTYYRSPSALNAGLHVSWTNVLLNNGTSDPKGFANNSADDVAVPLPTDVANAIGVPTGTKHIGTF